ncbi:hypothetical protein DENSPDRAFT_878047 [Dentipellis sp. KUC8613]|nr:hypothetical protein DENSPDRAFT_878047 [Dentipellis sp. KUC8613]
MSAPPDPFSILNLPPDAVARATTNARRDGAFAGLTAGLVGAIIASRMKLGQNKAIVAGIATGILSGYHFTQGFLASNMSILRAEVAAQQVKDKANRDSEFQEPSLQE